MRYFITLLILFSCLDGYSQKVAVRLNALPATDGAFGAGVSYGIGNKSTVELAGSLRPWKRSEMYVNRYWLIQPEYKYWTCQKFNGFFWGGFSMERNSTSEGKNYLSAYSLTSRNIGTRAGSSGVASVADTTGC